MVTNSEQFKIHALAAGADEVYEDGSQEFSMYEDDGNFFIEHFGLRAAFGFGQDCTRKEFNHRANEVLKVVGYEDKRYVGTGIV